MRGIVLAGLCLAMIAAMLAIPMAANKAAIPERAAAGTFPAIRSYGCLRTEKPPAIDGALDDDAWKAAPWSDDFVDIEGESKPRPTHRTRMKMLWDANNLYIAAELDEPHVWGTLTERDCVIFQDNDFEVFIDPDGDGHAYGELELNVLNTQWDLLLTKPYRCGGMAIDGWDIRGLKTAVKVHGTPNDPHDIDIGWTVEIAWPWKNLAEMGRNHSPPKDGTRHRLDFSRVEWDIEIIDGRYRKVPKRPEHNWVWSPTGLIDMHRPERWGYVQYSDKTAGPITIEPEASQPVRDALFEAFEAQKARLDSGRPLARTLDELGLAKSRFPIALDATGDLFELRCMAPKSAGGGKWTLRHDGQLLKR